MLLCLGSAFSFILEGRVIDEQQQKYEQSIMQFAKFIYDQMNKRPNNPITKEEFTTWVKDNIFANGRIYINDLFHILVHGMPTTGESGVSNTDSKQSPDRNNKTK